MAAPHRFRKRDLASLEGTREADQARGARLLELDPELGARVPQELRTQARAALVARTMTMQRGR